MHLIGLLSTVLYIFKDFTVRSLRNYEVITYHQFNVKDYTNWFKNFLVFMLVATSIGY